MDQDAIATGVEPAEAGPPDPDLPEEQDWAAYYRYTLGREPRPLFLRGWAAIEAAGAGPGTAVDVGFGDGTETMHLLEAGWRVTAIDSAPAAAEVLEPRVPDDARDRLTTVTAPADEVDLPPFDLLYSAYVLSYLRPTRSRGSGRGPASGSSRAGSSSSTSSVTATRGWGSPTRRSCRAPRWRRCSPGWRSSS